jgi:hypothetical protein
MPDWPQYTWDERARQYRDARGRFVKRKAVRDSLDQVVDSAGREMREAAQRLRDNADDSDALGTWQRDMERLIKTVNVAAAAIAAGGWEQATQIHWGMAGARIRREYEYLRAFAQELEAGLPLDGRFVARAQLYANSATRTYEAILRRFDRLSGLILEKRILNSGNSCADCERYAGMGWQPAGTLPGIGEACACGGNCRCSFLRKRARNSRALGREKMPATHFDRGRCLKRNRVAALKFGIDSIPLRLADDDEDLGNLVQSRGSMPKDDDAAMRLIRALQPADATPLQRDEVLIHYLEAGSSVFLPDRFAFIDPSTLKNVQQAATAGFAFMNSHRTGGLSSPSELPFGRTFCGRYEMYRQADGTALHRTLLGIYMRKGEQPNGANGPTTDALSEGIRSGTIFDVSMGLASDGYARAECDVCGHEVMSYDCNHVPGTTRGMSDEEIAMQKDRGVPGGAATYTYFDFTANEVSAVYDGAVPGAGFSKARRLARAGQLSKVELRQAAKAYRSLARKGDFRLSPKEGRGRGATMPRLTKSQLIEQLARLIGGDDDDADEPQRPADRRRERERLSDRPRKPRRLAREDRCPAPKAAPEADEDSPVVKQLRAELDQLKAAQRQRDEAAKLEAEQERERKLKSFRTEGEEFAKQAVKDKRALPAELSAIADGYRFAATDDFLHPLQGEAEGVTRLSVFKASIHGRNPHFLGSQFGAQRELPPNAEILTNIQGNEEAKGLSPERREQLLKHTEVGRRALALKNGKK